jgi:hypothetical protein
VHKLKDRNVKKEFEIQLRNKYEQLANEEEENKVEDDSAIVEDTIENKWDKIKATLLTVCEQTLGYKEERKDWISAESWKLIQERRAIKQHMMNSKTRLQDRSMTEAYTEKNKDVKK